MCIFLSPLIGAVAAGVAVEFEIGLGGTMVPWFVLVAVILNIIVFSIPASSKVLSGMANRGLVTSHRRCLIISSRHSVDWYARPRSGL